MSKNKQSKIPNKVKSAVLICDSINSELSTYSCLTFIDEWPTIWYTLHWLTQNNVEQVFLLYSKNKPQIQTYFATYGKSIQLKYHLQYVKSGELKNFGDAMRQIQFRNLVNEDFLVMYADTVTNIDLSKMVVSHHTKKEELKNVVLTTAFQTGYSKNIHVLNSNTGEILQIQQDIDEDFCLNVEKINPKKVNIDVRRDLVPISLFICTVEVLKSFKESFQYTTMNEFIVGMLTSEVYEEKMNAYVIERNQKAFRNSKAANLYLLYMSYISSYLLPYTVFNQQMLQPRQKQLRSSLTNSSSRQFNKIIKKGSTISQRVKLSNNIYIGKKVLIENDTEINQSIILDNAKISSGVKLFNCVVLQGCQLKGNVTYNYCRFQNICKTLKIVSFKQDLVQTFEDTLVDKDLFKVTPNDEENDLASFEEDLQSLLTEEPSSDSVTDLFTLRKCHNKNLKEFTKQMTRIINPAGLKGVQQFAQKWGTILFKLHEEEDLLLSSLLYTCEILEKYQKALHVFLQVFYFEQILSKEAIKRWAQDKSYDSVTLNLCKPFLAKLDQESQDEDEEDECQNQL